MEYHPREQVPRVTLTDEQRALNHSKGQARRAECNRLKAEEPRVEIPRVELLSESRMLANLDAHFDRANGDRHYGPRQCGGGSTRNRKGMA